jgi:hypothetical protein
MTSVNPPEPGHEPADLSELSATDALLDRIGRREADDDDLGDAATAALLQLVAFVDESREPDLGMSRLVEVLAGRPMYLTGPEDAEEADEAVKPVRVPRVGAPVPADPDRTDLAARISAEPRVIDLTDRGLIDALVGDPPVEDADETDEDRAQSAAVLVPVPVASELGSVASLPRQFGSRRWERALSQISLPAAAVVLLLVLGGGLSAVVTGNPMTAVNGVTRVVAQLPGVDSSKHNLDQAEDELRAAQIAIGRHDKNGATWHLARARQALSDVPEDQKQGLSLLIANVASQVAEGDSGLPGPVDTAPAGIGVGSDPSSAPVPVSTSTDPASGGGAPTSDPSPTSSTGGSTPDPTPPPTTDPVSTTPGAPDTPAATVASDPSPAASQVASDAGS